MAVTDHASIKSFDDWYQERREDPRTGCLEFRAVAEEGDELERRYRDYQREMDARVANYDKLLLIADADVATPKADLPNISSGETAGMIRRMARNLVQHTPNVDVVCEFDDDSPKGVFARYILKSKIIGDDEYSNDMQQNLFASAKMALTLGFDCVIPVLQQDAGGSWEVKYDSIHYRDVFPEPGVKDVRDATEIFVRRYLTRGQVKQLIRGQVAGWDIAALKAMLKSSPPPRKAESVDHQSKKHKQVPQGYEIITWYSNSGDPFLTFSATEKTLLRIEVNKHPLKWMPVFFLVLEKDLQQPLGKSQVELVYGRQEFQDLLWNGAMKMWYRDINPAVIGYGTNTIPNLSPGKFTQISNPNSRIEPFGASSATLMSFGQISQQNAGNMVQLVGAADQQMAAQSTAGGMSATPQGVEAQRAMVDITTNNYQKAIESFFSRYCSYALTMYFAELRSIPGVTPTADTRRQLLNAGMPVEAFEEDGSLAIQFKDLATQYFVRTVPGSLVELEDEKQMRVLHELLVPVSQALPAIAQSQDPVMLQNAAATIQFIMQKQIELSGSAHSSELKQLWVEGATDSFHSVNERSTALEAEIGGVNELVGQLGQATAQAIAQMQQQLSLLTQGQQQLMGHVGIPIEASASAEETVQV